MIGGWNHNIHYHDLVLRAIPAGCGRALDVGCGTGLLARKLALRCDSVIAMDVDKASLSNGDRHVFVQADAMKAPFDYASFDLITAVAALHHLPLREALAAFRDLLRPGGVLVIIGLYRPAALSDYALAAAAFPVSRIMRGLRGAAEVGAALKEPAETFEEIRSGCGEFLPGAALRRRLLFRYSLIWHKPPR